ncbi:MAG: hypothetical protein QOF58_1926 [Pseudonocardiales bacterium]|nr:hypothetical protein [Pseudonocardiales bacterium]
MLMDAPRQGTAPLAPCLVRLSPAVREPARIVVCVPWSGAGPRVFEHWASAMPADVELLAVILPGRDGRQDEPLTPRLEVLAAEISTALDAYRGTRPMAIFGHSLGALLGYQIAVELQQRGVGVDALVASGSRSPVVPPAVELHRLGDDVLLQRLSELGGLAEGPGKGAVWRQRVMDRTRADLVACEAFLRREAPLLWCDVTTWAGSGDWYAPHSQVRQWASVSARRVRHRTFDGDHFFVRALGAKVLLAELGWSTRPQRDAA